MAGMSKQGDHAGLREILTDTASTYDKVVRLVTLGMDGYWKRHILAAIPPDRDYRAILDLACGTGLVTFKLAERFPQAKVTGIDLMPEYIEAAREKQDRHGVRNVEFLSLPAEEMGRLPERYDLITASLLPKLMDPDVLAQGCRDRLNPGGVVILHDFTVPRNPLLRIGYNGYWWLWQRILGLSRSWRGVADNLGTMIAQSSWERDVPRAFSRAGFTDLWMQHQPLQISAIMRVRLGE